MSIDSGLVGDAGETIRTLEPGLSARGLSTFRGYPGKEESPCESRQGAFQTLTCFCGSDDDSSVRLFAFAVSHDTLEL